MAIIWLNSKIVEFFDVDTLTKVFEVKMSSVPNMIRVSNNFSDLLLYFNDNVHVVRLVDFNIDTRGGAGEAVDLRQFIERKTMNAF